MRSRILWLSVLAVCAGVCRSYEDEFLTDAQSSCYKTKDTYSCLKFRTLRYLSSIAKGDAWQADSFANESLHMGGEGDRVVRLVQIKDAPEDNAKVGELFEETRQLEGDSEYDKFLKFGKRQFEHMLRSNGITFSLPEGAKAIPYDEQSNGEARSSGLEDREGRGKKKKLAVLMPLLSLVSLFKIKLLLVPILLIVLFIKKILILATLFLPSILSTLKVCKMPHMPHHGQHGWSSAEISPDYGGGYAGYGGGYSSGSGGYSKDWAASRAYNGYKQVYDKQQNAYKTIPEVNNLYAGSAAVTAV